MSDNQQVETADNMGDAAASATVDAQTTDVHVKQTNQDVTGCAWNW